MNELDKRVRSMRKGMTPEQFKDMHECWAIGAQINKIREVTNELHQRVFQRTQGRCSVWWALSTNDCPSSGVPTYMALWVRRHKIRSAKGGDPDKPISRDGELHKHVRFLFHGPISVAEQRVPELAAYVVKKLKW